MNSILVLVISFMVWSLLLIVEMLEKVSKGDRGGVSILPAIPTMPALAWLIASGLDRLHPDLGLWIVGGLHSVMLPILAFAVIRNILILRAHKRNR